MRFSPVIAVVATALACAAHVQTGPISFASMQQHGSDTDSIASGVPKALALTNAASADATGNIMKRQEDQLDARAPMTPTGGFIGKTMDETAHSSRSTDKVLDEVDDASSQRELDTAEEANDRFGGLRAHERRAKGRLDDARIKASDSLDFYQLHLEEKPSLWKLGKLGRWEQKRRTARDAADQDLDEFIAAALAHMHAYKALSEKYPEVFRFVPPSENYEFLEILRKMQRKRYDGHPRSY